MTDCSPDICSTSGWYSGSAIRDKIPVLSSEHTFGKVNLGYSPMLLNTIAVPIFVYEEVLGVLSVFDDNEERTFAGGLSNQYLTYSLNKPPSQ